MIPITEENHNELIWKRTGIQKNAFELTTTNDSIVGILRQSVDETIVKTILTMNGEWIIVGTNYLNPRISIWTPERKLTALYERNRTGSGELEILNGNKYSWIYQNYLQPEGLLREQGTELTIHFFPSTGGWKVRGKVNIRNYTSNTNNLALIAMLGWMIISLDYSQVEKILSFPIISLW
jgi:hypothetical protein